MIVRLEDFCSDPNKVLSKIFRWIGDGIDGTKVKTTVQNVLAERLKDPIRSDPNAKYKAKWCGIAKEDNVPSTKRNGIINKYQNIIKEELGFLGYDLQTWCE